MLKAAYLQSEDWSFAAFLHHHCKNSSSLYLKAFLASISVEVKARRK